MIPGTLAEHFQNVPGILVLQIYHHIRTFRGILRVDMRTGKDRGKDGKTEMVPVQRNDKVRRHKVFHDRPHHDLERRVRDIMLENVLMADAHGRYFIPFRHLYGHRFKIGDHKIDVPGVIGKDIAHIGKSVPDAGPS
ncbi:MAG: hypothetical protein U5N26_09700 [Candidatus Marinimicrobia bacterium]|nr:hypothetical protein [Candidatus Neomarinimicrobiota bacterium]